MPLRVCRLTLCEGQARGKSDLAGSGASLTMLESPATASNVMTASQRYCSRIAVDGLYNSATDSQLSVVLSKILSDVCMLH